VGSIWNSPDPPRSRWLWAFVFGWLAVLAMAIGLAFVLVNEVTVGLPSAHSLAKSPGGENSRR
jgi:hypothetical protein